MVQKVLWRAQRTRITELRAVQAGRAAGQRSSTRMVRDRRWSANGVAEWRGRDGGLP